MRALLRNRDFLAGMLFLLAGAGFFWLSRDYGVGTARRMGPGYFPSFLSIVLMVIGAGVLAASFRIAEHVSGFALRGMAAVVLATVLFGALIREAGILVAVAALILIGAAGNPATRWLPMTALALLFAVGCYALFVLGLGLPIPAFGAWFGR